MGRTRGHVFAVKGDLNTIACDARLVPSDSYSNVRPHWEVVRPVAKLNGAMVRRQAYASSDIPHKRVPYLVDIARSSVSGVDRAMAAVEAFFAAVRNDLDYANIKKQTRLPIVALPLVGTDEGQQPAADVVKALVPLLRKEANRARPLNIVLVLKDARHYAAVQSFRANHSELRGQLQVHMPILEKLAHRAKNNKLVIFCGAGVSAPVGIPTWHKLLEKLLDDAFATGSPEREAVGKLNHLDQAAVLSNRVTALRGKIVKLIEPHNRFCSLLHALLASLPVSEYVTTNYDSLLESAIRAARGPEADLAILPHAPRPAPLHWVVKLHGSVEHEQDIVLSRGDYMRYGDRRIALRGIVQGMLMTRHLLFVGFSMHDDNFHQIADDVRKALGEGHRFGTVASVERNLGIKQLWQHELEWVDFQSAERSGRERKLGIEELQQQLIFFDRLCLETASKSCRLDPLYTELLTKREKWLADSLNDLAAKYGQDDSYLAKAFAEFMKRNGAQ